MSVPEQGYFTEADSAEVVISRNRRAGNERLAQVMEVIIRKLHEAVREIEPTQAEWMEAIRFLTATGHKCDDRRQEASFTTTRIIVQAAPGVLARPRRGAV